MSEPVDVVLQAAGLHKRYTEGGLDVPVLQGVELTVRRGETLAIVGASGSGKSTLLHLLGGLEAPTQGRVTLLGRDFATMNDPFESAISGFKKGDVVTGTVSAVQDNGVELTLADGVTGFIRKSDLSRDRAEQRPDRYAIGEKVDAKITTLDRTSRKIQLSIKAREIEEDKEAMAQFGSSDSGASLGDILGAALKRKQEKEGE